MLETDKEVIVRGSSKCLFYFRYNYKTYLFRFLYNAQNSRYSKFETSCLVTHFTRHDFQQVIKIYIRSANRDISETVKFSIMGSTSSKYFIN